MLKRIGAVVMSVAVMTAIMATGFTASAASMGTDVMETFERYKSNKALNGLWKPNDAKNPEALSIILDTQNSAPNRGDGKAEGNYRSLRANFDLSKQDGWAYFRINAYEDPKALYDVINNNRDCYLTFWAKSDKNVKLRAEVDIKNVPFYQDIELTTQWKEYKLNLRTLIPEAADKNGNMTKIYERNAAKAWGQGEEVPYLCGFKFQLLAEINGGKNVSGSLWLDTVAVYGDGVTERRSVDGYDTEYDRAGSVPSDFVAPTNPPTNNTTNSPKPTTPPTNNPGSSNNPGTPTNPGDPSTPGGNTNPGDPSDGSSDGSTTEPGAETSAGDTDSTTDENAMANGSTEPGDGSTTQTSADSEDTSAKSGSMTWLIVTIVIVVLLGGGGAAFYFLYWKKRETPDQDSDDSTNQE